MGYMTVVSILNDGLDQIEKNPEEFVKGISENLHGKYQRDTGKYQKTISFGVGNHCNQVDVYQSFHADNTQVFFAGWNSLVNMNEVREKIHERPNVYASFLESTLSNLSWIIKDISDTFLKELMKYFSLEEFKTEEQIKDYFKGQLNENEMYKELSVKHHLGDIFNEKKLYKEFQKQTLKTEHFNSFKEYFYALENGYKIRKAFYVLNRHTNEFQSFDTEKAADEFLNQHKEDFNKLYYGYGIYSIKLDKMVTVQKPLYTLKETKELIEVFITANLI